MNPHVLVQGPGFGPREMARLLGTELTPYQERFMDMYATMKKHEARLQALEASERPKTDTAETTISLEELRQDLGNALERLADIEARLDGINAALDEPAPEPAPRKRGKA